MRDVINIEANIVWGYFQDHASGNWIGVSEPLKLTVEADTLPALHESMTEAMDCLFNELLSSGDLDRFLGEHGWTAINALPARREHDVCFDVPLNTRRISQRDLDKVLC